jgi:hypothetical protein
MPKILTIDVESAPLESFTWGIFDQNVGLEQIKTEWSILSYAAKWLDSKKIYYGDVSGRGSKKIRDDKPLMGQIWELLDEADIVVAQNGKRFDIRKINARLIMHGYGPYSPVRVVDTMISAKKYFAFTSQKLKWTSQYLTDTPKDEHKEFPGFELWIECLKDNPRAWREMKKYNIRDIIATEKVYLRLRPWIDGHPNVGAYSESDLQICPKCGSDQLQRRGDAVSQAGKYARYMCKGCAGWSRGKIQLLPTTKRKALLVPQ